MQITIPDRDKGNIEVVEFSVSIQVTVSLIENAISPGVLANQIEDELVQKAKDKDGTILRTVHLIREHGCDSFKKNRVSTDAPAARRVVLGEGIIVFDAAHLAHFLTKPPYTEDPKTVGKRMRLVAEIEEKNP